MFKHSVVNGKVIKYDKAYLTVIFMVEVVEMLAEIVSSDDGDSEIRLCDL